MRLVVLGDTHFGCRNDSLVFQKLYADFYENIFFPYLIENKITTIVQMGDLFDRRKFVNFNTLHLTKKYFFSKLKEHKIKMIVILGNHDISFKNTLEVNSIDLLLEEYIKSGIIYLVKKPESIVLDEIKMDFIPWICEENDYQIKQFIKESRNQICFGHFQIAGFEMDRGHVCSEGISREGLNRYPMVITGHFHHRSTDGHIFYVGAPCEQTWADYGDKRGFHIFDTHTRELEFIENPYHIFYKIVYDEDKETLESVTHRDYDKYQDAYIKVIVIKRDNPIIFNKFIDNLYEAHPSSVEIVEDFTSSMDLAEEDIIDQCDDTMTIIGKFVDSTELSMDKERLKNMMYQFYLEAQQAETRE